MTFITNLSNIKQGLKQDYTDDEILEMICVNTSFTDRLISEHMNLSGKDKIEKQAPQFVKRDARAYREFIA